MSLDKALKDYIAATNKLADEVKRFSGEKDASAVRLQNAFEELAE